MKLREAPHDMALLVAVHQPPIPADEQPQAQQYISISGTVR